VERNGHKGGEVAGAMNRGGKAKERKGKEE
jgi:hypothetical protein